MPRLELLQVPDCPNADLLRTRLDRALAGYDDVVVIERVIRDVADADATGMTGSPTLLVDGVDPFTVPGARPSVSCRLYRDVDGRLDGAPTVTQLRHALDGAGPRPLGS